MASTLLIIVTYNAESWLPTCMGTVRALTGMVDAAIVDNASTDGTRALLAGEYRELITHYHPLQENIGFGKAHNHVFAQAYAAEYDYYFLLNQDAAIGREALQKLVDVGEAAPQFGVLSPLHYFDESTLDFLFEAYILNARVVKDGLTEVPFVNAALWLLRAKVVHEIGGFNPIFPHYGEDDNFVKRLTLAGYRVGVVTEAKGYHYRRQLAPLQPGQAPYRYWLILLNRLVNPGKPMWKSILSTMRDYSKQILGLLLKGKFSLAFGHARYFARVLWKLPAIARQRRLVIPPADSIGLSKKTTK